MKRLLVDPLAAGIVQQVVLGELAGVGAKLTAQRFRKGFYTPRKWEAFENITRENKHRFQASDHHCLWTEVDV